MALCTEDQLNALRRQLDEFDRHLAQFSGLERTVEHVRAVLHDDLVEVAHSENKQRYEMVFSNGTRMRIAHHELKRRRVFVFHDGHWYRQQTPPVGPNGWGSQRSARDRYILSDTDVTNMALWLMEK